jgi:hypothetical protein
MSLPEMPMSTLPSMTFTQISQALAEQTELVHLMLK